MTDIQTESIDYTTDGTNLKGYLACSESTSGSRPGVVVIHEWWGLNDYIKRRANMVAELGYAALAIDMYGDGQTADNPDAAGALMNGVLGDMAAGTARLRAGYETLVGHPSVDPEQTAAIGYCFGGAMVLHMARIGIPVKGVVSFHGSLGSFHKPKPGEVKSKVLVCHGAADEFIPESEVENFKAEMDAARADYRFEAYAGALHGFTSPEADANGKKYGLPLAYDAEADEQSWQAMLKLFAQIF